MVFNLDDRIVVQSDKATFSIPIGLGAADKAAGKAVPQIIMVITGPQDIQAAAFSTPTPASVLLPKILEEIETNGSRVLRHRQVFPARRIAWAPDGTPPLAFSPLACRPAHKAA